MICQPVFFVPATVLPMPTTPRLVICSGPIWGGLLELPESHVGEEERPFVNDGVSSPAGNPTGGQLPRRTLVARRSTKMAVGRPLALVSLDDQDGAVGAVSDRVRN